MTRAIEGHHRFAIGRSARRTLALASLTTLGFAGAFWWPAPTSPPSPADPANERQVSLGHEIYTRHCAVCHGRQLEGQPDWRIRRPDGRLPAPPHDESGHTWHHPDRMLFEITRDGAQPPHYPAGYESDMPAFGQALSDEEIWAVLAYIKSSWPEETQEHQRNITGASGDERQRD
jgi:mono/diheme cytochrome c family protein